MKRIFLIIALLFLISCSNDDNCYKDTPSIHIDIMDTYSYKYPNSTNFFYVYSSMMVTDCNGDPIENAEINGYWEFQQIGDKYEYSKKEIRHTDENGIVYFEGYFNRPLLHLVYRVEYITGYDDSWANILFF